MGSHAKTPKQVLADKATKQNRYVQLGTQAAGLGVTRGQRETARDELVSELGERGAKRAIEIALRQAGARPKGIRRFIG